MAGGILWIASYPKSGNTWVRIFLENLFSNSNRPASINTLNVTAFGDAFIPLYRNFAPRPIGELDDESIHKLREPIQRHLANQRDTSIVKTHNLIGLYKERPLIHLEYSLGAIYIVRNVFDVTVSFARHYNVSISDAVEAVSSPEMRTLTTKAAIFQILGRWCDHYRSWTSVPGFSPLIVRYEDMKNSPVSAFTRIVNFLKLPADKVRINKAIRFSSFEEASRQERTSGFRESVREDQVFFHSGKTGSWKSHLTAEQVNRLIDVHGEVLRELKYIDNNGNIKV